MFRLFHKNPHFRECPIVVAQFKRSSSGAGNEEHLHWAIIILTDEERLTGIMYHVLRDERVTPNGRRIKTWAVDVQEQKSMEASTACLGAVRIGVVKPFGYRSLDKTLREHRPVEHCLGWNSQDWVIECIRKMKTRGWATNNIYERGDLIPALKRASALTETLRLPAIVKLIDA